MDKRMKRLRLKIGKCEGMTLIEVMIAVVILSIMLIAVISLTNVSLTGIFTAGKKSQAIAAAMEKSDQVFYIITNADNAADAEADMRSFTGWTLGEQYVSSALSEPQFCYEKRSYMVDGLLSEGFDVSVFVYYNNGKHHVKIKSFVLKRSDND